MNDALIDRYKNALSWRVATDLCRRDASLLITFPEGGSAAQANSLMVGTERGAVYEMRRSGGGVVAHAEGTVMLDWDRVFGFRSAREVALELERSGGVENGTTPPTEARALGYRFISTVLDLVLTDPRIWDWHSSSQGSLEAQQGGAPTTVRAAGDWHPELTRWHLIGADNCDVEIDSFGWIKTRQYTGPLLPLYEGCGRRVSRLVAKAVGDILP